MEEHGKNEAVRLINMHYHFNCYVNVILQMFFRIDGFKQIGKLLVEKFG